MRTLLFCSLMFLVQTVAISQQKDFKKWEEEMEKDFDSAEKEFRNGFSHFVDSVNQEYINLIREAEKDFLKLLKDSFREFEVINAESKSPVSKPQKIPLYKKAPSIDFDEVKIGRKALSKTNNRIILIQESSGENKYKKTESVRMNLWRNEFSLSFDTLISQVNLNQAGPEAFKDCYEFLLNTNYSPLIEQMADISGRLNLSDWDYFCMVNEFSKNVSADINNQKVLSWFLLLESGFKVKIGYHDNDIALLFAPAQTIYNMPFFDIRGERYYTLSFHHQKVTTYEIDHFKGINYINIWRDKPLLIPELAKNKTIKFPFKGSVFNIELSYDQNYIDYYSNIPDIKVDYYFALPVSSLFKESIEAKIGPLLENKSLYESLHFLLSLVQYGFDYKTDAEQFNKEKYMTPEETFHYEFSDCDDRAILYSWLVSDLLDLDNIAIDFGDHLCVAVEVTDKELRGGIRYNGKDYIICDPTYRGAPPGILFPQYRYKEAGIIDFAKNLGTYRYTMRIWEKANSLGLLQAENSSNIVVTNDGSIFLTGSYSSLDPSFAGRSGSFVAKLNSPEEIQWEKNIIGEGRNYGYCISVFNDRYLYVFGYFENSITIDNQTISSKNGSDFFLAQLDLSGNLLWLKSIETPHDSASQGLTVVLDQEGSMKYYMPNDHFPPEKNYLMEVDEKGRCYIYAALPWPDKKTIRSKAFVRGDDFNIVSYLLKSNEAMLMQNYPRSVSFLYTIIRYLNEDRESTLKGSSILEVIKEIYSNVSGYLIERYSDIGRISEIRNSEGLTVINTIDQKPITFHYLQALHGSRLKLSYINGNAKITVLNGVKIGNDRIWNRLNYILLDRVTGEIVYNYDNQYRKKMPVHTQLL